MFNSVEQLNELLVQMAEIGVILDLAYENGTYHFKFKTQQVKENLREDMHFLHYMNWMKLRESLAVNIQKKFLLQQRT